MCPAQAKANDPQAQDPACAADLPLAWSFGDGAGAQASPAARSGPAVVTRPRGYWPALPACWRSTSIDRRSHLA